MADAKKRPKRFFVVAAAVLLIDGARTSEVLLGENDLMAGVSDGGSDPSLVVACVQAPCVDQLLDCGDCVDNDGDGVLDMNDPDCLGPCDGSEDAFYTPKVGDPQANCVLDCFFDGDNGVGNDTCAWSLACDPRAVAPDFAPGGESCAYDPETEVNRTGGPPVRCEDAIAQPDTCASICGPLTPNGCDCFGCCDVPGAQGPIWLGSVNANGTPTCDRANIGDAARCPPCTQNPSCTNSCEECELCVLKNELPASCLGDGGECVAPTCPRDQQPCGLACLDACPVGEACVTGCCVPVPE